MTVAAQGFRQAAEARAPPTYYGRPDCKNASTSRPPRRGVQRQMPYPEQNDVS